MGMVSTGLCYTYYVVNWHGQRLQPSYPKRWPYPHHGATDDCSRRHSIRSNSDDNVVHVDASGDLDVMICTVTMRVVGI